MHKTANVPNKLPKHLQPKTKSDLHQMWMAATRDDAHRAFATFVQTYELKYPKAAECLAKDQDTLLAFYDGGALDSNPSAPRRSTFVANRCQSRIHTSTRGPSTAH